MDSHEVMKRTINSIGVKYVASEMNLSSSLIYKWCQPKEPPDESGADNPLDRIVRICRLTQEREPIEWLCRQVNGFFVQNPPAQSDPNPIALKATQEILREFSELLDVVSKSIEDDQVIDCKESLRIREVWETLKTATETFVVACERGRYGG